MTDIRTHKSRLVFRAVAVLALLLLVAAGVRIYQINAVYPSPTLVEHRQGEVIRGGDFELTVTQTKLLSYGELLELVPTYEISMLDEHGQALDGSKLRMLVIEVDITNTSTDERELFFYQFNAQSKAWHNGVDLSAFLDMNEGGSLSLSLPGGESTKVTLPFLMIEAQFKSVDDWTRAKERPYDLVLATYPILDVAHLQLSE
jgi:hypothetical protein